MTDALATFDELCQRAVKAFLQTVVVIDNEASLNSDSAREKEASIRAARKRAPTPTKGERASSSAGGGKKTHHANAALSSQHNIEREPHRLELNHVSRAFAAQELTCGVYLPSEQDPACRDELVTETARAILPTDACVLDWQLREGDSSPAIDAIKQVLKTDVHEGGRLRLVLVYTAENLDDASKQLKTALETDHEATLENCKDGPVITGNHFRIRFVNKPTRGLTPDEHPDVVPWDGLPERIIREFTALSRGLLRAFALQSVAAVRRDMHRILAQFEEELDPVYAGDRATKLDQDDASGLIVDLLSSELNYTLFHSTLAKQCLNETGLFPWLDEKNTSFRDDADVLEVGGETFHGVNSTSREALLKNREARANGWLGEGSAVRVRKKFFPTDERAESASLKMAALSTLARTSIGRARPPDGIRLRFGTIVRVQNKGTPQGDTAFYDDQAGVFLCLQPSCDTVRITDKRPFLMVRLVEDERKFVIALPEASGFSRWRVPETDERFLLTPYFNSSHESDSVLAASDGDGEPSCFIDCDKRKWFWLADLRDLAAVEIRDKVLQPFARTGLNSLEWLRLRATKGK